MSTSLPDDSVTVTEAIPSPNLALASDTNPMGPAVPGARPVEQLFQRCMLDNLREGVVFVDRQMRVTMWNRAAEQITGIRSSAMLSRVWLPSRIDLKDRFNAPIEDARCPVNEVIRRGESKLIAASVTGRGGRQIAIDLHVVPVLGPDGTVHGANVLIRDLSNQVDLEQQVLTLYATATRDQLTGVSNRSHFERSLDARLREFVVKGATCSLIIADIDFFKAINDEFGHHVGDQALMAFAKLLSHNTRVEDLVARYGGEEFVILCPDCDLAAAMQRAEEIRNCLQSTQLAVLNGKCLTASFGVSQFRTGDTAMSAFIRADQALLRAKEQGRNCVVSLCDDVPMEAARATAAAPPPDAGPNWRDHDGQAIATQQLTTTSPMDIVISKLRGWVQDYNAKILRAEPDYLEIRIDKVPGVQLRRLTDRHTPLIVQIELQRTTHSGTEEPTKQATSTVMNINVRPFRHRDRRHKDLANRAQRLIAEIRGYLMIT
jgi:diguanylate cyclase (GGDEF)-like protein/PAS domain S-box-containing protein